MEELKQKWNDILNNMCREYEITDVSYRTWLMPLQVYSIDDNKLYLIYNEENAVNQTLDFIKKKYKQFLEVQIEEATGKHYEVFFILNPNEAEGNTDIIEDYVPSKESNLISKYLFENFVVGSNNRFAQNAALAVAESPGESYNPLYIYGGPGLGKTHLLHAIGNFINKENPNMKILYVTSEAFLNEIIEGIRSNKSTQQMANIREKYRSVDVLIIDDIQFIIDKEQTQVEFFNTFNSLRDAGKQIVISSDRPPRELGSLDERFKSRFEQGLMADIGMPEYETRMAILREKLKENTDIVIPDEVLNYIANNIKENIRELEGALLKLTAIARMQGIEITMDIAEKELYSFISPDKPRDITPQLIIEIVADHYNISLDDMRSKKRERSISQPRQIAMYLCKKMTNYSQIAIGNFLGGKDHSTVIHACDKISTLYEENSEIKSQIDTIIKKINPG